MNGGGGGFESDEIGETVREHFLEERAVSGADIEESGFVREGFQGWPEDFVVGGGGAGGFRGAVVGGCFVGGVEVEGGIGDGVEEIAVFAELELVVHVFREFAAGEGEVAEL